ncbi:hypothetical protein TCDM_10402 [Trypanosoma cruzi Dm28c]|uniref:Uncharacterized protein n=1 Tax=Trypanosoma cruzi Dm28c TaxID=1416333 RepID=V5AMP5_TRYCR|nr:hypothetical protein TCDM_10402 [Trypanosoma cruzi Dm28c]
MKRRVLRAHANKSRLRLLSAENGLRLDSYNILCDASFMRAFLLAEGSSEGSPAQALRALMYDTFSAATSHVSREEDGSRSSSSARIKKPKELNLSVYYLLETATTLRRMFQRRQEEEQEDAATRRKRKRNEKELTSLEINKKGRHFILVVESLLEGLECIRGEDVSANKNEAKAIARFLAAAGSKEGPPTRTAQGRKNANFFLLPRSRMTFAGFCQATPPSSVSQHYPRRCGLKKMAMHFTTVWTVPKTPLSMMRPCPREGKRFLRRMWPSCDTFRRNLCPLEWGQTKVLGWVRKALRRRR